MPDDTRKLVTIVTESVLEQELCETLEDAGAAGYTVTNARGIFQCFAEFLFEN